jgi:hypothetical protein
VTLSVTGSRGPETGNWTAFFRTMAITQIGRDTPGRAYYQRKRAAGKSHMEALRCLKRRLSDVVYRQLLRDSETELAAGPGGHSGAALSSCAAG